MPKLELQAELDAYFDEDGIGVVLYMGEEDDEGFSVKFSYDTLFDDILDNTLVDRKITNKEDREFVANIAKALAEVSKDFYCILGND